MLINKKNLILIVQKCLKEQKNTGLGYIQTYKSGKSYKSGKGDGLLSGTKYAKFIYSQEGGNIAIAFTDRGKTYVRPGGSQKKYKKITHPDSELVILQDIYEKYSNVEIVKDFKSKIKQRIDFLSARSDFDITGDVHSEDMAFKKAGIFKVENKNIGTIYKTAAPISAEIIIINKEFVVPKAKQSLYTGAKQEPTHYNKSLHRLEEIDYAFQVAFDRFQTYIKSINKKGILKNEDKEKINDHFKKSTFRIYSNGYQTTSSSHCYHDIKGLHKIFLNPDVDKGEARLISTMYHEFRHGLQNIGLSLDTIAYKQHRSLTGGAESIKQSEMKLPIYPVTSSNPRKELIHIENLELFLKHQMKYPQSVLRDIKKLSKNKYPVYASYTDANSKNYTAYKKKYKQLTGVEEKFAEVTAYKHIANLDHMWRTDHVTMTLRSFLEAIDKYTSSLEEYPRAIKKLLTFKAPSEVYEDADVVRGLLSLDPKKLQAHILAFDELKQYASAKPKVKGMYQIPPVININGKKMKTKKSSGQSNPGLFS